MRHKKKKSRKKKTGSKLIFTDIFHINLNKESCDVILDSVYRYHLEHESSSASLLRQGGGAYLWELKLFFIYEIKKKSVV